MDGLGSIRSVDARTTLRADPGSAAAARRFVADVLWQRGFSRSGIEAAVLITSEVVTNAVVHAGTEVDVVVVADGGQARVEVHDGRPDPPVPQPLEPEIPTGFGMHVIDAVAECWGVREHDGGKCVWFEVRA